jgi:hypothetical protein
MKRAAKHAKPLRRLELVILPPSKVKPESRLV